MSQTLCVCYLLEYISETSEQITTRPLTMMHPHHHSSSSSSSSSDGGFERMNMQTETSLTHVDESFGQCRSRFLLGYVHIAVLIALGVLLGVALGESSSNSTTSPSSSCPNILLGGTTDPSQVKMKLHTPTDKKFDRVSSSEIKTLDGPSVCWLMSFPNSGTSYTSKLVRRVSEMSTASNYGQENRDIYGNSIPVYPNRTHTTSNGPFWIDPASDVPEFGHPKKYVLTKTHCGGRCEKCPTEKYIENPHSFLRRCLSGSRAYHNQTTNETQFDDVTYSPALVTRAVHLIRSPFDNIVSRFHLELHSLAKHNETEQLEQFTNTRQGFRRFCAFLAVSHAEEEEASRWWDPEVYEIMKDVPCHADFFRWIQWHNLAFVTTQANLGIPAFILHYEDYETRFDDVVKELFDFLELPIRGEVPEFIKGKEYIEYFTPKEQSAVKQAMAAMALQTTWGNIFHYFE